MDGSGASNPLRNEEMEIDIEPEQIFEHLKAQGIFDNFRKDCLSDVDTKPAYQNLSDRINSEVKNFLKNKEFNPKMNKQQLRTQLKNFVQGRMDHSTGDGMMDRIVEQIVNPQIQTSIRPKIENEVNELLGPVKTEEPMNGIKEDIVENGCDQVDNGQAPSEDVDMKVEGVDPESSVQVPVSFRPGMIPPPPPPDSRPASSNGGDSSPGLAGQISPLTPGRDSPPPPTVAAGDISPLTPTRGGDISPLTPPPGPPQENSHDIPSLGAEGEIAMEVDSHTPPGSPPSQQSYTPPQSYTPTFPPPPPQDRFIQPHPVPYQRPLTPHTPPLPPLPPSILDMESGGEASMSSISDGDIPDVSPPRQSPRSPSSSDEEGGSRGSLHQLQVPGTDPQARSGPSDISDTELPSAGSDRPESGASVGRGGPSSGASHRPASKESWEATTSRGGSAQDQASISGDENIETLEDMRTRLMAKLQEDFQLSPDSDSEGEYHSNDDDDDDDNETKPVESNEDSSQPPADMSPVSDTSISVTPVPAIADPSSSASPRPPSRDSPSSPQPETSPPPQVRSISPNQPQTSPPSHPQSSNISPNQLLRMRSLPIPPAKSLNTAQVLKTLPFPEGEGRPPPPEPEAPKKGPQTPPPPPCEPWDRPRGPRTPEPPRFSPERPSRTPSPDSEPLYYEKQTRDYDEPPSPPSAFSRDPSPPPPSRRGPRTPPSSPPQSSFSRLDLSSEESINTEQETAESGCKPFVPPRRDSRDSDGGGGSRFGGSSEGGAPPPSSGGTVASGATETKGPVSGSTGETAPTSKTNLPSKDRMEKKKEMITKQQKAKIEKYDQQIKTKEKIKSDKFLGFDLFSTIKTPKTPHMPHRKPQDSGQKSPGTKTPTSSRTSSSSKTLEFNHKEKDKKGKSEESFLKPGKIPDRRSSLDVKKDSDSKTNSRDHEGRSSSGKERRSSTSSDKERGKGKESRDRDRGRDTKDKEKEKHKERHSKEREREKNKEKEKHKERDRSKSDRHREKSEEDNKKSEKSRKNSGQDDLKKMERSDKDQGREKSRNTSGEKNRDKYEEDAKQGGKSRKESGEDDKKKTDKDEYNSNFEEAKLRLKLKREKMEKEEKERKKKIELEKKEEKNRRAQIEKEKKKKLLDSLKGLSQTETKDFLRMLAKIENEDSKKKIAKQLLGELSMKESLNKKNPVISDHDSSEDEVAPRRKEKQDRKSGGSFNNDEIKSPSGEKLLKKRSENSTSEISSAKKPVISDDDSSEVDSSDDEDVKSYIRKNKLKSGDSNIKIASENSETDSPGRSTRSQIIKSMRERPVKVNVDRSLTKNIDFSKFIPVKNTEEELNEAVLVENIKKDQDSTPVEVDADSSKSSSEETNHESALEKNFLEEVPSTESNQKKGKNKKIPASREKIVKTVSAHSEETDDNPVLEQLKSPRIQPTQEKNLPIEDNSSLSPITQSDVEKLSKTRDDYEAFLRAKDIPTESCLDTDGCCLSSLMSHMTAHNLKLSDITFPTEKDVQQDKLKSRDIKLPVQKVQDKLESPVKEVNNKQDKLESTVKEVNNKQDKLELPVSDVKGVPDNNESPVKEVNNKPDKIEPPVKEVKNEQDTIKDVKNKQDKIESPVKEVKNKDKIESPVKEVTNEPDKVESPVNEVQNNQDKIESPVKEVENKQDKPESPVKELKNKQDKPESPVKELENRQETLQSPPPTERRGKKRSGGPKWEYVTEWVPDKPVPQTKVEKELLINNGAVDYLESARGSAKRPRKANVKYSEEFTTGYTDSEEDVARSLSKPSLANNSITSTSSKKRTSSETVVTPKKDSVITPPSKNEMSPGGRKRNSSKQIIANYIRSAGVKRNFEEDKKVEQGSISCPENPVTPKAQTITPMSTKDSLSEKGKMLNKTDADPSEENNVGLADMERQLDREIAAADKELHETKLFLLSKRKKRRGNKGKSRVSQEPSPEGWNPLIKLAIKKVKSSKQACNVERIAGAIRRCEPALKNISDDDVEKRLDQAAEEGVIERIEKQEKITYRIPLRGASSSELESSMISLDESSNMSSTSEFSQLSSEDKVSNHKIAKNHVDSSDEMDDLIGFSSEEIRVQNRILHFDTFDQLESGGAKFSNLDELEGVSLNDDLLKSDDEEPLKSSNLEVLFSEEIMMYINNLKESEREHLDNVKSRGKSTGKSQDFILDESDEKGSSSPESFGSSKENQPTVSSVIGIAKRNHAPNKFIQDATRKRRSGLQEGQSLKTRKVS